MIAAADILNSPQQLHMYKCMKSKPPLLSQTVYYYACQTIIDMACKYVISNAVFFSKLTMHKQMKLNRVWLTA